jgi:hypothetical protein
MNFEEIQFFIYLFEFKAKIKGFPTFQGKNNDSLSQIKKECRVEKS